MEYFSKEERRGEEVKIENSENMDIDDHVVENEMLLGFFFFLCSFVVAFACAKNLGWIL